MISREEYVMQSLELHLFWGRIMKEHLLFLEAGFAGKNTRLIKEAENYKVSFEKFLLEVVKISNGVVSERVIDSGEIFTEYTLEAEKKTKHYTGLEINFKITLMESHLQRKNKKIAEMKTSDCVKSLNCRAIKMMDKLICFKEKILEEMISCKLVTSNYPMMLEHIIEEAKKYQQNIKNLENNLDIQQYEIKDVERFWNEIFMEHALFIRGMLDPSEENLIDSADKFAKKFKELMKKASDINEATSTAITSNTLIETAKLIDFKKSATKGILGCKIKSIILPLLSDHVLREANHYLRILEACEEQIFK